MFKKAVYGITTIILLCGSCQDNSKNCLEANVEIRNESLKESILEYDSIIRNDPKNILLIFLTETTCLPSMRSKSMTQW